MADVLSVEEKRVCLTLARLFRDAEVTDENVGSMAGSLSDVDLSVATMDHILRNDIFPILYTNIISVAGVWTKFDNDWLLSQVAHNRKFRKGWAASLVDSIAWMLLGGAVTPTWNRVKESLQRKRNESR
jgi:hypothetical protein